MAFAPTQTISNILNGGNQAIVAAATGTRTFYQTSAAMMGSMLAKANSSSATGGP